MAQRESRVLLLGSEGMGRGVEGLGLQEKLQAGEISTMPVISDLLMRSHVLAV